MQNRSLFPYLQGENLSTGIKEEISQDFPIHAIGRSGH